jgi:hypothetical protein
VHCEVSLVYFVKSDDKIEDYFEDESRDRLDGWMAFIMMKE